MPSAPGGRGYYSPGNVGGSAYAVKHEEPKPSPPEPRTVATVVELMDNGHMLVALGPGAPIDVEQLDGVRVGDRVFLDRQSVQPLQILRDETPTGTIITVERVHKHLVESLFLGQLRTFRSAAFPGLRVGERVVIDPSSTFVIGTMGMPPAKHARPPAISVSWDDIGGQDEAKEALREAIELPYAHPHLFKQYGKRASKGVMLWGPPGAGKTLISKASATALARAHGKAATDGFIYVKGPELINSFIGRSEENVRNLFAAAREHKTTHGYPALVFIDECDALLGARDRSAHTSLNATVVPQFLAEMDGLDDHAAMFILATNRPDMLDPAVVRDGRIDRRVKVTRPSRSDAAAIFKIHLRGRPLHRDTLEAVIARATDAMFADERVVRELGDGAEPVRLRDLASGALIAGVIERASTRAMRRDIQTSAKLASGIGADDVVWAIDAAQLVLRDTDVVEAIHELAEAARQRQNVIATVLAEAAPAGGVA